MTTEAIGLSLSLLVFFAWRQSAHLKRIALELELARYARDEEKKKEAREEIS